jgi:hypothetical protein
MSRFGPLPGQANLPLSRMQKRQQEEACYQRALALANAERNTRESARAKQELAYFRHGEPAVAERLYREASVELERAALEFRDSRWHSALGRALRDRADLLARSPNRLDEASALLRRAMAIHSFHGRDLQMAYSVTTAARIAFTACRYSEAIALAMDAANRFETSVAWRGWADPVNVLLESLAELGQAARMKALTEMLIEKASVRTNLEDARRDRLVAQLKLKRAHALWLAGDIAGVREALASMPPAIQDHPDAVRLSKFIN